MAKTNLTGKELVQIQTLKAVKENLEQQIAEKSSDNQKVATNTVTFGANDTIKIVAGSHATVVGDASAKTITIDAIIPEPEDAHNQKVKVGSVTFGADDVVNFVGGGNININGNSVNKEIEITGIDTTYTFSTGNDNGSIHVKASDDSIDGDVAVKGLNTAAYKDVDTTVTKDSDKLVTSGAVATAVANLAGGMVFQGSVGDGGTKTWANVGTASATNKGYVYKVITKHTTAPVCEVGDLIISNGTEWVVIPSGDEPSGTVTSVGLEMPAAFSVTSSPVTSSGTLTVGMATGYSIPTTAKQTAWDNKQDAIDDDHKLSADAIDDTSSTNKFVTATEKETWSGKQDKIDADHKLSADVIDGLDSVVTYASSTIKAGTKNVVTAATIVTDGAQAVSSTSHGVALGGTSAAPTVTVTPGSVAEDNTSVVTGGDVYTAITEYAEITNISSLAGEEITTITIGDKSVDVAKFDQRGSFFYRGSIDPIDRSTGAPNPALIAAYDFHDQDLYFYDEENELWQYSSAQGGAVYKVIAMAIQEDLPAVADHTEALAYLEMN